MPAPIDPARRQAIITDIKAGKPRNQIAGLIQGLLRAHGEVSHGRDGSR